MIHMGTVPRAALGSASGCGPLIFPSLIFRPKRHVQASFRTGLFAVVFFVDFLDLRLVGGLVLRGGLRELVVERGFFADAGVIDQKLEDLFAFSGVNAGAGLA